MKNYLIIVLLLVFISCENENAESQAQRLFKKASIVVKKNPDNHDSLKYAIILIDSAIRYDKRNVRFYLSESHIFLNLKQYDKVIDVCNIALAIDRDDFYAILTKGVAFDKLNNSDSSHKTYGDALRSLDKTKFASEIFKDYQRIIIHGLLNDSTKFQTEVKEFDEKYSKSPDFAAYNDELRNFKKADYLDSY